MATPRARRGYDTEKLVAEWFRSNGWVHAEAVPHGTGGHDIVGMPGYSPEVKARADFNPVAWLRQAEERPGLPFVVVRPNGFGPANRGEWLFFTRLDHGTELLKVYEWGEPSL